MESSSSSALSDLINSSPLQLQTLVEFLRFRQLTSGGLVREVSKTLGDEITNFINGEKLPANISGEARATSEAEILDTPYFQFLLLNSLRNEQGVTTNRVGITRGALHKLCIKLGVSLNFLDAVLKPSIWSKQSGGCFHIYDSGGEVEAINGFYHYFNEWHLGPLHTWFLYNVKTKCTTYILFDCPQIVKEKLFAGDFVPQPLSIDFLLAEECALWREELSDRRYKEIFNWHEKTGAMDPPLNRHINAIDSMQTLHQLSRTWNMIYEDLGDLEERLDFLISTAQELSVAGIETRSVVEHLEFVRARNHLRRRWVTSFGERTKLIINFVFSLSSEENSKANVKIAISSSWIAKETARDNSSMMTIATMTMLFLPGAFVASVLQVSNKLWQFFAATIPATILVLVAYQVWRRTREARLVSSSSDLESNSSLGNRAGI